MKTILFCGDKTRYGFVLLGQLLESDFNITGVVLTTHRKWRTLLEKNTGQKIRRFDVFKQHAKAILKKYISRSLLARHPKIYAKTLNTETILKKHRVPYWHVDDVNSAEHIDWVKKIKPDILLCAGFPQIFSKELLMIPVKGAVNFHPSLLPKFRGPHPFFWIIAKGEEESAVTAHFMTEKIDGGDIIAQRKFPILDFTYDALVSKCIDETPDLIKHVYAFFSEGNRAPQKQDHSVATYFRSDRESDHRILWSSQDIHQIHNLIRTGRAFCFFKNRRIRITECSVSETGSIPYKDNHVEEGTVVNVSKDSTVIKAKNGYVDFLEVVTKGRKMRPREFTKRLHIQIGHKFG